MILLNMSARVFRSGIMNKSDTIGFTEHIMFIVLRFIIRDLMLRFDRKVLKRYLNVQTPLYRLWWSNHCQLVQAKLDAKNHKNKF